MLIKSRSSIIALISRITLWIVFLVLTIPGLSEGPRVLIFCVLLFVYVLIGDVIKLFINCFKSPEWIELKQNNLIIKPRFRNSYSIQVGDVTRITEAKIIKLIASYDRKIICSERKLSLYFGKAEFVGLDALWRPQP